MRAVPGQHSYLPGQSSQVSQTEHRQPLSDEMELLARARQLDEAALSRIHDEYYQPIFRYIMLKVSDRATAEDLTSEVFVRLLNALRDSTAPQNTLRGWLYSVASFTVNDYYRKQYRAEKYAPLMERPEQIVSVDRLDGKLDLKEALTTLTPEQMDVIALRFGQGLRIREVAQLLGKQEGAIKQLQARAIAALSRKLSGQDSK